VLNLDERWLGKRNCIKLYTIDKRNPTKITKIVEQLDGDNVKLGEPANEVMGNNVEVFHEQELAKTYY